MGGLQSTTGQLKQQGKCADAARAETCSLAPLGGGCTAPNSSKGVFRPFLSSYMEVLAQHA